MSVEAMAIALHHSRADGAALVILLGIANHHGDGGAWPSVATLAKYARIQPRGVQKHLTKLVGLGEIRRHVQAGGDHRVPAHLRPNRYDITLKCPSNCDRTAKHAPLPLLPDDGVLPGVPQDTGTGVPQDTGCPLDTPVGVSERTPKPSLEPSRYTDQENPYVGNREELTWISDICAAAWRDSKAHTYSPKAGKCIYCFEIPTFKARADA